MLEADSSGHLLALVLKGKLKSKGKGKGKDQKSKRTCYECGSEDHLADKCQIRIDRVLAGGPERLDDPMGKAARRVPGRIKATAKVRTTASKAEKELESGAKKATMVARGCPRGRN